MDPKDLLSWAQDTSDAGRQKLAKAVSQFFEDRQLNETEQSLASEILLNLIRQAELDLREALAERLSIQKNIPPEVIVYLANDHITVARQVLMHSPVLNDVDLVYIISSKGEDHSRLIAKRDGISPLVADRLIDGGDVETMLNLIDNQRVHLQKASMKKLAKASLRSEELQAPLLRRPEVDTDIAIDLYMIVSQALRKEIAERFLLPPQVLEQSLEDLIHELSNEAKGMRETSPDMISLARRFEERKDISADLMIKTLRRGQVGFFLALFAERTGLMPEHIVRMVQKDGGKPFVVACRHIGMMKSEFASIFLLSRGIRTGDKIVDQRELAMALKNFDAIRDFDVQRIMKTWVNNPDLI
ncbi:MAG: DUF2336 domain-containing protein [Bdellovibrionales bacterium]|nr:DUF2336 domain-containing protein [Bdellovibrionales bacterium]